MSPHDIPPHDVRTAFQKEFATTDTWITRAVVVGAAAIAGLVVVGFSWLAESGLGLFLGMADGVWWLPLLWTPLACAAIVWVTRRHVPGAAGSGIPQVIAALDPALSGGRRPRLVSLRLSMAKIGLTSAGLLGGLSLGREGPSVQIAAGVMLAARRWLPRRSGVSAHSLLVAGGAAGIAAAFNTPLAGVMFAIEELSRTPEQRNSGLIVAGIVLAGLIAVSIHGNGTHFGVIHPGPIGLFLVWPGLLVTLVTGAAGGLFARLLLTCLRGQSADLPTRWRARYPVRFAAGCGLAVAIIGAVSAGATYGSGNEATRGLLENSAAVPGGFAFLKFAATWLTAWSGVPAGIFAPSLSIGAALGHDIALLTGYTQGAALIALGMVGFLAAATQAPLTAFIIVMEMVDGHGMVLSLMACAVVASTVSRVLTPPLYTALATLQLPPRRPPGG
ncbi:chloride channel protein [Pseudoduganella umbonata]|uniref:Chloride channel protein n=1 Tax=Pseudoduganella umbonata TaxID=864828 RepID=A0A4P8HYL4_9BURK|nr:chloride channel protein [Pseudoduganella umbonata]MBB3224022.1 H+/Cl- antiporter ClcA [Pseudoduganella umbonata]QCP14102.1 chloride channel protein [Pseudoduganella umbonata]